MKSKESAINRFSFSLTLADPRKAMFSRKLIILTAVLVVLFSRGGVVFAENSAMFDITTATPSSAQAGKEIVFEVRITNTGIETWVSEEYFVLVKIYDASNNYLAEADKVRQFEDINPGEVLATEVPFDIPDDYSGTYSYTINIEFEDASLLNSSYFSLRIIPIKERKGVTGTLKINYVNNSSFSPSTNINLSVLSEQTSESSLALKVSARNSAQISELQNYFFDYRSKSTNVSLGQLSSALSYLTLRRLHGIKIRTEIKGMNFTVLADLPKAQKSTTAQNTQVQNLYGIRGAFELNNNFTLAGNYAQSKNNRASVASLEGDLAITPQFTISGEYAHSSLEENGSISGQDGAFRITASGTSPKLSFNCLYQKVGQEFHLLENSGIAQDSQKYDFSLNYSLNRYIRARVKYNLSQDQLSQQDIVSRKTRGSMGLSLFFPKMPSVSIAYGVNESLSAGAVNWPRNSITNSLTIGVSKSIGRTRLSLTQTRTNSEDKTKSLSKRDTLSTTYGISRPLSRQLTFSASYRDSITEGPTLSNRTKRRYLKSVLRYTIIPAKLTSLVEYAINESTSETTRGYTETTMLKASYYFTQKGSLTIQHTVHNTRNFASNTASSSDSKRTQLNYTYKITQNHHLSLSYYLVSRLSSTSNPQGQNFRLTYSYKF